MINLFITSSFQTSQSLGLLNERSNPYAGERPGPYTKTVHIFRWRRIWDKGQRVQSSNQGRGRFIFEELRFLFQHYFSEINLHKIFSSCLTDHSASPLRRPKWYSNVEKYVFCNMRIIIKTHTYSVGAGGGDKMHSCWTLMPFVPTEN